MARQLTTGRPATFVPGKALMPVTMQLFGLQDAKLAIKPGYGAMRYTCNACPAVGRCWQAMRADADAQKCRGFCPNAEAFERSVQG